MPTPTTVKWKQMRRVKFMEGGDFLEAHMSTGGKLIKLGTKQVEDGALLLERYLRYTCNRWNAVVDLKELVT
jgi:hypothetical protein